MNNKNPNSNPECLNYLKLVNGSDTPYGKIIVFERDNFGGSMGAFSQAFDLFEDIYDYWLFLEDDVRIIYPRYFEMIINEFNYDKNLGFLALTKILQDGTPRINVSGGVGASKKDVLKRVKQKYGKLPYDTTRGYGNYGDFGNSEFLFTNCYYEMGIKLRIPNNNDVVMMADNWEDCLSIFGVWQKEKNFDLTNKKFLFHLGL